MRNLVDEKFAVLVTEFSKSNKRGLKLFSYRNFLQAITEQISDHMLAIGLDSVSTEIEGKTWFLSVLKDANHAGVTALLFYSKQQVAGESSKETHSNLLRLHSSKTLYFVLNDIKIYPITNESRDVFAESLGTWLHIINIATTNVFEGVMQSAGVLSATSLLLNPALGHSQKRRSAVLDIRPS